MLKQAIFLIFAALILSSCGSPYILNIDTVPTGATIWQVGATSSYTTPVELAPDPNFRHPTTKCILVTKVYAKWQSGATVASHDPLQLCDGAGGGTWTLTLKRPSGYPGLQIDLLVEQRILLERQLRAERGAAAMAAGFESLGRGLGCLAAGGGCSSSDTSYSYSPPATTAKPVREYQEEEKSGDDQPIVGMGLRPGPGLGLGVTGGDESHRNHCPITSPYYLTPSCLGE